MNLDKLCAFEFNVPTSFRDDAEQSKKDQESMDPLKYRFDIIPGNPCFMHHQNLQGIAVATHKPPSSLLDIERYLQTDSLIIENNRAIVDTIHKKLPGMPEALDNKMIIPECSPQFSFNVTRLTRPQRAIYSTPCYMNINQHQKFFMPVGRNTRLEVKDQYKKNNPKVKNANVSFSHPPLVHTTDTGTSFAYSMYPCIPNSKYNYLNCSNLK